MSREKEEPLYMQVSRAIREEIVRGELPAGGRVPPELELCERFHVSRVTIRHALDELAHERLIERRRPVGTFVRDPSSPAEDNHYTMARGFTADLQERGLTALTMSASLTLEAPEAGVASWLGTGPGDLVMVLRRVRGTADGSGRAFALFVTSFTPVEGLPRDEASLLGSFYGLLRARGIVPLRTMECTEAILPPPDVASALGVRRSQPVLKRTIRTRQQDGPFREHSECFYVGSEYKYYIRFQ